VVEPAETELVPTRHHGAQHLEVLRRLNAIGTVSPRLADRVLRADLAGRGHGLLGLVGDHESRFGTPPVDPADLTQHELMRVVISLLAEDVAAAGVPPVPPVHRPRVRRIRYRLGGDPLIAEAARADLVRRGYPEGGDRTVVFLVGRDLPTMLGDAWTWRALVNGTPSWEAWLDKIQRTGRIPESVDLTRQARWWGERVGDENVRIVTDPGLLPGIFRVDAIAAPLALSAEAIELARLVSPIVGLHVGDAAPDLMVRGFAARLASSPGTPLAVPERWQEWVGEQARLAHEELIGGHYAVLGDPDLILAPPFAAAAIGGSDGASSEPAVLALALRTLLENDPDSRVEGA
jgi:hypothetical protein